MVHSPNPSWRAMRWRPFGAMAAAVLASLAMPSPQAAAQEGSPRALFDELRRDYESGASASELGRKFLNSEEVGSDRLGQMAQRLDDRSARAPGAGGTGFIEERLSERGYRRIVIIDGQLPRLIAEACQGADRVRLVINRWGDVVNSVVIGRCAARRDEFTEGPLVAIRAQLRSQGFTQIRFLDRNAPYRVEACGPRGALLNLTVSRFGDVIDRQPIGRCEPLPPGGEIGRPGGRAELTPEEIRPLLRAQGFRDIRYTDRNLPGYRAEACRDDTRYDLAINRFGQVRSATPIGRCAPQRFEPQFRLPPPRRIDRSEIRQRSKVKAEVCQEYFEALLYENQVQFETGSARLTADNRVLLEDLANVANRCPETTIEIGGHTDSVGDYSSNQVLSEDRAQSVEEALVDLGVDPRRLSAVGYGEERPIADNFSAEGRAQNRRVEFTVKWQG